MEGTTRGNAVRAQEAARVDSAAAAAHQACEVIRAGVTATSGPWADRMVAHLAGRQDHGGFLPGYVVRLGDMALTLAAAVEDSATATAVLLRKGVSVQLSGLGAARTCLEASARAVYLYAAGEDVEEQIARGLELAWTDREQEDEMRRWGLETGATPPLPDSPLPVVTEALGWTVVTAKRNGRHAGIRPEDSPKVDPRKEPAATTLISRLGFDEAKPGWRMTSAAGHGRPWMVGHEVFSPDIPAPGAAASTASIVVGRATVHFLISVAQAFDAPELKTQADRLTTRYQNPVPAWTPPHRRAR